MCLAKRMIQYDKEYTAQWHYDQHDPDKISMMHVANFVSKGHLVNHVFVLDTFWLNADLI